MGMLNGSGLLPVPADQVEAAAALGIGAVSDGPGVAFGQKLQEIDAPTAILRSRAAKCPLLFVLLQYDNYMS